MLFFRLLNNLFDISLFEIVSSPGLSFIKKNNIRKNFSEVFFLKSLIGFKFQNLDLRSFSKVKIDLMFSNRPNYSIIYTETGD